MAQQSHAGQIVPESGVYRVTHEATHVEEAPHEVTYIRGHRFPDCPRCSAISFELLYSDEASWQHRHGGQPPQAAVAATAPRPSDKPTAISHGSIHSGFKLPVWEVRQLHRILQRSTAGQIERLADFLIASVLLMIAAPLILIIALAIKWETAGPVFESRTCIGWQGRRFRRLTFRTAVHDPYQALPPWARMPTQVGQFIWQTRMHALPQLVNVIRGEMGIVDQAARSAFFLD